MSSTVIQVENLSKQYRLGTVSTGTIGHDVNRWWHRVRGKEDPYLKIGETNDRTIKGASEYVWALRDIDFEIKQGDVLGIIGRNGAGKSTLLKILSRTTAPTSGRVRMKGRIASLLEVGTGFHPELTGRENVFLNGAILGMTRQEISRKFDEIIEFSGVERYIDTPVKRYSSGMYVRLAFAVAAFLDPEILIVDEVLAVGDADFQRKCLIKLKEVSAKSGKTVLFVSHNVQSLRSLCERGLLLKNGLIEFHGSIADTVNKYLENSILDTDDISVANLKSFSSKLEVRAIRVNGNQKMRQAVIDSEFEVEVFGEVNEELLCDLELILKDEQGNIVAFYCNYIQSGKAESYKKGNFYMKRKIEIPQNFNKNIYRVDVALTNPSNEFYLQGENIFVIDFLGTPTKTGRVFSTADGSGYLYLNSK